jgi:hypothetical protein
MNQSYVSPLVSVFVHVIRYLAQQNTLFDQYPPCLGHECRIGMSKCVAVFLRRARTQSEPRIKILGPIASLVWDMRRIIDHHIEGRRPEWNSGIVSADVRAVPRLDVQPDYRTGAVAPEPTTVDCRVEDQSRLSVRIKSEKLFDQFGIFLAVSHRIGNPRSGGNSPESVAARRRGTLATALVRALPRRISSTNYRNQPGTRSCVGRREGNRRANFVLAGLVPAIHALGRSRQRRGCADQVRARRPKCVSFSPVHSAASAWRERRRLVRSPQLSASMNSAQRQ